MKKGLAAVGATTVFGVACASAAARIVCVMTSSEQLSQNGYALLERVMSPGLVDALHARVEELFELEGVRAGEEFRQEPEADRLANLVDKGEIFRRILLDRRVIPFVESVLGPGFKLSSVNVRRARPHGAEGQPLHVDMGMLPDEQGPCGCNTIWMLTAFTKDNGSIRIVPGSHLSGRRPQDALDDPHAPHPDQTVVEAPAGSVLIFNTHAWHAGMPNRTDRPRTALNVFFCRRDKPQQLWQKKWLSPETQASLSPELRALLALDDPENDRLSADPEETSGFMKAAR